jgi:hypothetical protein
MRSDSTFLPSWSDRFADLLDGAQVTSRDGFALSRHAVLIHHLTDLVLAAIALETSPLESRT